MFFNERKKEYVSAGGPVRYLDGSSLARPFDLPKRTIAALCAFVLVAAVIGGVFLYNFLDTVLNASAREQASVEQNLARDVSYDLPQLSALMAADDDAIRQTFADAGLTIYDKTNPEENPNGGLDLVKLPSDVTEVDAALLYTQGVSNLSAADAAKLLKGSWTFTVSRNDYVDMRVKYADFSSGSVEAAIQAAMASEGLEGSTLGESGVDDAGNTFQTGTIDVDGTTYAWRVSAIALSSVYDITGLPDTAVYVGVRMTP